jgi:sugar lactone lactonase YvrE
MIFRKINTLLISVVSCLTVQAQTLEKLWETDTILRVPECVYADTLRSVLYVSNIGGQPIQKDEGSVAKITPEGKILAIDWIPGLNAPKGMALSGKELFVAEPAVVVVIDVEAEKVVAKIPVPSAKMLNDVCAAPNGDVYVSDTRGGNIIRIRNRQPEVWVEGLDNPNGVLFANNKLHFVDKGRFYSLEEKEKKLLADDMDESTDGIEQTEDGDFLISCWSGIIYYVKANGEKTTLLDTRAEKINAADIGWDVRKKIMYVPTFWKNKVVAYQLK